MSAKLAYRLAILTMISPVIIIALLVLSMIHRQHLVQQDYEAQKALLIAQENEMRLQHQHH